MFVYSCLEPAIHRAHLLLTLDIIGNFTGLPYGAAGKEPAYLPLCLLCSLPLISPIGALLDIYCMNITTLLLPTIFAYSLLSTLSFSPEVYQLPPPTMGAPTSLLPMSATHQSCLTMTVATTNHCYTQLPISDQSVSMITTSHNSCHQDHLPLLVSITPSRFGSIVLMVVLPYDCLVSLLSIFPFSIDTQCPVLSVDPLSL